MSQDERLMILQMVADKKVTASEAADLLRALDNKGQGAAKPEEGFTQSGSEVPPSSSSGGWGSGLGAFIEEIVEKLTSAVSDVAGPRHEFTFEHAGSFAGDEVPLRIATSNGRVELRSWDEPGYKATVLVKVRCSNPEEAQRRAADAYTVKADESGFDLEARRTEFGDLSVNVVLMVPRDKRYRLETRTGNGGVDMIELPLSFGQVTTGNGRIYCRSGRIDQLGVRSGNGSVEIESDVADLEAGTGNGSVTVRPVGNRPQIVRISTGNGSVRVSTRLLPPQAAYKVEAQTGMGSVNVSLPGLIYDRDVRSMGHKQVIARSADFDQAEVPVTILAKTGLGSVTIE